MEISGTRFWLTHLNHHLNFKISSFILFNFTSKKITKKITKIRMIIEEEIIWPVVILSNVPITTVINEEIINITKILR